MGWNHDAWLDSLHGIILPVKNAARSELFRKLPSVDDVMRGPAFLSLAASHGHDSVVDAVRAVLARLRQEITSGLLDEDALELALSGLTERWRINFARRWVILCGR